MKVRAANFRGINGNIELDFRKPKKDSASSVLLLGDNGSGKSSLIDAIEFALRGRLSRRSRGGEKQRREVRNLTTGGPPGVIVELSDGRLVRRGGGMKDSRAVPTRPGAAVDGFGVSPIAIRRQDIESFWRLDEEARKDFFYDYLRTSSSVPTKARIEQLELDLDSAEVALTEAGAVVKAQANLPSHWTFPGHAGDLKSWEERVLLPRVGTQRTSRRRDGNVLPQGVADSMARYREALIARNTLRGNLEDATARTVVGLPDTTDMLLVASERISEDFAAIAQLDWIDFVTLGVGTESELTVSVVGTNGKELDPRQVLSEASLDLLALLIILEVHIQCAEAGQAKIIALDDVFQSVDSVIRIRALDHIFGRLAGWQVIVSLHDRLWSELTVRTLSRNKIPYISVEVISQGASNPPILRSTSLDPLASLNEQLDERAESAVLCSSAGRALERLCDELSVSLSIAVSRKRSNQYTLGELWPGVQASLNKNGNDAMKAVIEAVEQFSPLRNLVGAHYNEWADSISSREAHDFGIAVRDLWRATTCDACGSMFTRFQPMTGSTSTYGWGCKHLPP